MGLKKAIWKLEEELETQRDLNDRLRAQNDQYQATFIKQMQEIAELRNQRSSVTSHIQRSSLFADHSNLQVSSLSQSKFGSIGFHMQEKIKQFEQKLNSLKEQNEFLQSQKI